MEGGHPLLRLPGGPAQLPQLREQVGGEGPLLLARQGLELGPQVVHPLPRQQPVGGGLDDRLAALGVEGGKLPGHLGGLEILAHKGQIHREARSLIGGEHHRQILPGPGGHQGNSFLLGEQAEVVPVGVQIGQHRRVAPPGGHIVPPHGVVGPQPQHPQPVGGDRVQRVGCGIVLPRVPRHHQQPPFRQIKGAEPLGLQQLQQNGLESGGGAVELVQKQNALLLPRLLHGLPDGGHNLAHGVLGDGDGFSIHLRLPEEGQAQQGLAGVVGEGVGEQGQIQFPGHLAHHLGLADARRAHEADGPGPPAVHKVPALAVLLKVELRRLAQQVAGLTDGDGLRVFQLHDSILLLFFRSCPLPGGSAGRSHTRRECPGRGRSGRW